jgi:hypothetical protein
MVTLRAKIREAFEMFDKDGKGTIVEECVRVVVREGGGREGGWTRVCVCVGLALPRVDNTMHRTLGGSSH